MYKIRKGLDLPITGAPEQIIKDGPSITSIAVIGPDYVGMKPTMAVKEGDRVKLGQLLFTDKKTEGVKYTSPGAGVVSAINRGERRVLQSIVIDLEGDEQEQFAVQGNLDSIDRDTAVKTLVDSGVWASLRTRPYSKVPSPASQPSSIFVTAISTDPLSVDPSIVIAEREQDFTNGLKVLTKLSDGPVHLCLGAEATVSGGDVSGVEKHGFTGPHPAGLVGTHIHFIDPVNAHKVVWHINYQDVLAIGHLFTTGQIDTRRVVSVAGPHVENPQIIRTRMGASLDQLLSTTDCKSGVARIISGSVLSGRKADGPFAYLGRFALQVSVIEEDTKRKLLRYLAAGSDIHSGHPVFLSRLSPGKLFNMTSSTNGSERAMVPIGNYEQIMPLDILPTQLLRALIVEDTETAQKLGCLELDEEDLALCTYVCVGKYEYGPILRNNLTRIEKEG